MPAAFAGIAAAAIPAVVGAVKGSGQSNDVAAGAAQANALSQQAISDAKGYMTADKASAKPFNWR